MTDPNFDGAASGELPHLPIDPGFDWLKGFNENARQDEDQTPAQTAIKPFDWSIADELFAEDSLTPQEQEDLDVFEDQFTWVDRANPSSIHRKIGRGVLNAAQKTPIVKHFYKFLQTANDTVDAFCVDAYVQYKNADTTKEKAKIIGMAATTGASQLADRLRLPEAVTIPLAVEVAESHGKTEAAAALLMGVYLVQYGVGTAWGAGMRKFKHATATFDKAYPGYKNYASEGNAGYLKTLYRQSLVGLGIGNSAFMAGEVMHDPEISTEKLLYAADRSSRRIGVTAGVLGYGALLAIEEWYDKSIGIPGVVDWTVPEVVENMKKASFWIIGGLALDIGLRTLALPFTAIKKKRSRAQEEHNNSMQNTTLNFSEQA